MNSGTLKKIGVVTALLVAVLVALEVADRRGAGDDGELLVADFREHANDVRRVTVRRAGDDGSVVIERNDDGWAVVSRDGYPANVGKVRELLIAIADARIVEAKTANPELHGRLGLDDPDMENSKGVQVVAESDGYETGVVFGNRAQGSYRYARLAGEHQTYLVDQDPDIPDAAGEWLVPDIVDIDSSRVRAVTIAHPDGETIHIGKSEEAQTDFDVEDIPEGRELSYSTVANGIGGALNDLELDDVRKNVAAANAVVTTFETFDGLTISVSSIADGDGNWITLAASAAPADAGDAAADAAADDVEDADEPTAAEQAAQINALADGWQFRVPDYKANLLKRRWDDILKAPPDDE